MGLRIQNNISAFNAHRNLTIADRGLSKSLERLSSGFRINKASDDAAGLAVSMRFRAQIRSLQQGARNATEATSLLQVAEGAADQITNILQRMKELATQAASTNTGSTDRTNIAAEVDNLEAEISRIANSTKYAGSTLIDGNFGSLGVSTLGSLQAKYGIENVDVANAASGTNFSISIGTSTSNSQITIVQEGGGNQTLTAGTLTGLETDTLDFADLGIKITVNAAFNDDAENTIDQLSTLSTSTIATSSFQVGYENNGNNKISFTLANLTASGLTADVNVGSLSGAQTALATIDTAIDTLASARAVIGRSQNQFGFAIANLASTIENFSAAESVIRDADMALETVNFTKNQILLQAGTAMLAQANASTQAVLQLLG